MVAVSLKWFLACKDRMIVSRNVIECSKVPKVILEEIHSLFIRSPRSTP
jgi:hypothetical protein